MSKCVQLQQSEHFVFALRESKPVLSMLFLARVLMSSMSEPICLWADWATSVGNTEEKSEVCMCVMCVTAAGLVHIATVAHSVTPPNKDSSVISISRVRYLFQLVCV